MVIERMFAHATGGKTLSPGGRDRLIPSTLRRRDGRVEPLQALHYDLGEDRRPAACGRPSVRRHRAEQRAALDAKSPYNVVRIDLPESDSDPYEHASRELARGHERVRRSRR